MILIDTYTKMLLALPSDCQLFKEWQWKEGDLYLNKYKDKWYLELVCRNEVHNNKIGTWVKVDWFEEKYFSINQNIKRPFPSQDQIQSLILSKSSINTINHLQCAFDGWARVLFMLKKFDNYNEAWFAFYMFIVYNKDWDGDKWA